jgi:hypothetical protein
MTDEEHLTPSDDGWWREAFWRLARKLGCGAGTTAEDAMEAAGHLMGNRQRSPMTLDKVRRQATSIRRAMKNLDDRLKGFEAETARAEWSTDPGESFGALAFERRDLSPPPGYYWAVGPRGKRTIIDVFLEEYTDGTSAWAYREPGVPVAQLVRFLAEIDVTLVPVMPPETVPPEPWTVCVGKYTLGPGDGKGRIKIEETGGEAGEFDEVQVEAAIGRFYDEHF